MYIPHNQHKLLHTIQINDSENKNNNNAKEQVER